MIEIQLKFSFQKTEGRNMLHVSSVDTEWKRFDTSYILGEICESLLLGSYEEIYFDFSSLQFVSSSCLGSFASLVERARELNKKITLDFGERIKHIIDKSGIGDIFSHGK